MFRYAHGARHNITLANIEKAIHDSKGSLTPPSAPSTMSLKKVLTAVQLQAWSTASGASLAAASVFVSVLCDRCPLTSGTSQYWDGTNYLKVGRAPDMYAAIMAVYNKALSPPLPGEVRALSSDSLHVSHCAIVVVCALRDDGRRVEDFLQPLQQAAHAPLLVRSASYLVVWTNRTYLGSLVNGEALSNKCRDLLARLISENIKNRRLCVLSLPYVSDDDRDGKGQHLLFDEQGIKHMEEPEVDQLLKSVSIMDLQQSLFAKGLARVHVFYSSHAGTGKSTYIRELQLTSSPRKVRLFGFLSIPKRCMV